MTAGVAERRRPYYPAFLDLDGRRVLVVGAGPVGAEKAAKLAESGAQVVLVSPQASPAAEALVADGRVARHLARGYEHGDAEGCVLAVAATGVPDVDRRVCEEAAERGIPVNVPGDPSLCTFIVPSVVRRGDLAIAVSTGGASPVVARRVRADIEGRYGPEWGALIDLLHDVRDEMKARHPHAAARREAVERLMATDVLARLARGDDDGARALVREAMAVGA